MDALHRSGCPINLTLEVLGDRWSLIIIRDIMFGNRRHFRELLQHSEEGIASNILADRLKRLMERGLLTRSDDPTHKQKAIYSLTEMAIELVPILAQMGAWGRRHLPASEELSDTGAVARRGWAAALGRLHGRVAGGASRQGVAARHPIGARSIDRGLSGGGGAKPRWRGLGHIRSIHLFSCLRLAGFRRAAPARRRRRRCCRPR